MTDPSVTTHASAQQPGPVEGGLTRIAKVAALLCPLAFLTSMAAMELTSKLLLLAVSGLVIIDLQTRGLGAWRDAFRRVDIAIAVYALATLAGIALFVTDPERRSSAFSDQRWILQFYAYLYFFNRFLDAGWLRYIRVYAGALTLLGVFSLCQFYFGWDRPRSTPILESYGAHFRAVGLYNLPMTLAGIAGMMAFGLLGFSIAEKQQPNSAAKSGASAAIGSLFGMVAVIASLTRAAWVSAVITLGLCAARMRMRYAVYVLLATVVLAVAGYQGNPTVQARFDSMVNMDFESNQHRLALWRANWAMIKDHPLTGLGGEENIAALPAYYERLQLPDDSLIGHAHSNVLQIWAGQGLVPLICYGWFSCWFLWRAYRLGRCDRQQVFLRGIGLGSFAAQLYFHLSGLTECNFADLKVNHLLVYLWALTRAADNAWRVIEAETPEQTQADQTAPAPPRP